MVAEIFAWISLFGGVLSLLFLIITLLKLKTVTIITLFSSTFFIISLTLFDHFLRFKELYHVFPHIIFIPWFLIFIYWPFVYLFISFHTIRNSSFRPSDLLHFAPALYFLITASHLIFQSGKAKELIYIQAKNANLTLSNMSGEIINTIYILGYSIALIKIFVKYKERIKLFSPNKEEKKIKFIGTIVYCNFLYSIFQFLILTLSILSIYKNIFTIFAIITMLLGIIIYIVYILLIGKFWIDDKNLFIKLSPVDIVIKGENNNNIVIIKDQDEVSKLDNLDNEDKKYEKSRLSDEQSQEYIEKLLDYMERDKPYKNSSLTIHDVAQELSISTSYLSQVINRVLNKNFYTFINGYRVKDVKEMLADIDNKNKSILSIAYSAGFNSKSTFNSIFKKLTLMTPSEYRKESLKDKLSSKK